MKSCFCIEVFVLCYGVRPSIHPPVNLISLFCDLLLYYCLVCLIVVYVLPSICLPARLTLTNILPARTRSQSYSWSGSQQRLYRDMLEPVNKVRNLIPASHGRRRLYVKKQRLLWLMFELWLKNYEFS
jgi:hypothetical protein